MNKAFVREPEPDGRAFCPLCGSLGSPVEHAVLDRHIRPTSRGIVGDSAWFCSFPRCDAAYFNLFNAVVTVEELNAPVYPKDLNAPVCACFGLTRENIEADADEGVPKRIRANLARVKSGEAECESRAADGRDCIGTIQRLFQQLKDRQSG